MSLQTEYRMFSTIVNTGQLCKGDECCGWFLSDFDTWHECPCNARKKYPHPEDDPVEEDEVLTGQHCFYCGEGPAGEFMKVNGHPMCDGCLDDAMEDASRDCPF